jgi:hypothetical protein
MVFKKHKSKKVKKPTTKEQPKIWFTSDNNFRVTDV